MPTLPSIHVVLDQNFYNDPKIVALDDAHAELLYVRCLAYSKSARTDGVVSDDVIHNLLSRGFSTPQRRTNVDRAMKLAKAGLMKRRRGAFVIVAWERWNLPNAALAERREAKNGYQRSWRSKRDKGPDTQRDPSRSGSREDLRDGSRDLLRDPLDNTTQDDTTYRGEISTDPPQPHDPTSEIDHLAEQFHLAADRSTIPAGIAATRAALTPVDDPIIDRAHRHYSQHGASRDDVARTVASLRVTHNVADTVIDEAIGQSIASGAEHLGYLVKVALDWRAQRDRAAPA